MTWEVRKVGNMENIFKFGCVEAARKEMPIRLRSCTKKTTWIKPRRSHYFEVVRFFKKGGWGVAVRRVVTDILKK